MERKDFKRRVLNYSALVVLLIFLTVSCQKAEDRTCYKSTGEYAELYIPLDSVRAFHLNKNVKYRIHESPERKVVVKGGANLVNHISVDNRDNVLYVTNNNKCNIFRTERDIVEVEIFYPHLNKFFIHPTDSVIFENTVTAYSFDVELRDGGGSLIADVDVHKINMVVSHGAADFTLTGKAAEAALKIQNNGAANAIGFRSVYTYIYQNSTADLFINLENSSALIVIDGTGDVFYNLEAGNIEREGVGSGQIIKL